MQQYLELLKKIKEEGTYKPAARENMPGTYSLFGEQLRFKLSEGFPLMTTKKINFKHIVTELLWFLKGNTNIKYLVDNGCNIWNEDAYNYYKKIASKQDIKPKWDYETFIDIVKKEEPFEIADNYKVGDCGKQYGKLWRQWNGNSYDGEVVIDQIKELIDGLKKNPMSRRHIITAWNPATLDDMALNACHAFVQFNCRPISNWDQLTWLEKNGNFRSKETKKEDDVTIVSKWSGITYFAQQSDIDRIPKYYLDCQMYQRSADVFLGVPYNIASYAFLTEMLAKICNMVAGNFIHTFGDVHIYENHMDAVNEQLTRTPTELPKLRFSEEIVWENYGDLGWDFDVLEPWEIVVDDYNSQPSIKAKLSTGLK